MTRPGSVARNVLSNWLTIPISVAYGLIITPIIVRALDTELYGVWSFLNGLLMYSDLLYIGLGSALIKYVAQYRTNNDQAGTNRLISVVTGIYGILGLACFVVMAAISTVIPHAFAEPLSAEAARAASATCLLLGAQLFFVFIGSAFSGLICGYDRWDLVNVVNISTIALRFIAIPLILATGRDPLFRLALMTASVAAIQTLMLAAIAYRLVPQLSVRPVRCRRDELAMLYGFGVPSFFIMFAVRLVSFSDTTIIGIMLGASSVALYALPLQLMEYARQAVSGFTSVLLPHLTELSTRGELAALRASYLSATRIACFLTAWLGATLMTLGPAFLNRWVGDAFGAPAQWVLIFLAVAAFGQVLTIHGPLGFYQAMHLVSFPAKVLMLEALANLGLSIWLAPRLGIPGVALATALPAVFISAVVLPSYLCRKLDLPIWTLIAASVFPGALMFAANAAVLYLSGLVITGRSYPAIATRASFSLPIAALVFLTMFPASERRALWDLLAVVGKTAPRPA
ncbi:MAG: polysaccharide biosynthesis C-terminal domain-containing protein [Cyanobacteria bacterium]|nr:polysaccharide biosynthesis C-terminal domain-containing protein [Cyanobacteriota bacterium]